MILFVRLGLFEIVPLFRKPPSREVTRRNLLKGWVTKVGDRQKFNVYLRTSAILGFMYILTEKTASSVNSIKFGCSSVKYAIYGECVIWNFF